MDKDFWHEKWESNQIAFHRSDTNPLLIKHLGSLALSPGSRIFVPLCGKTLDIAWLLAQGYRVVGVELVEMAIAELFQVLGQKPHVSTVGKLKHYRAPNLDIFVGDFFDLTQAHLGPVDAVYDRAAFVALPDAMRTRYVTQTAELTHYAPQLLITYEYDKQLMAGPPFSFSKQEVRQHFQAYYSVALLADDAVSGGLKGHPAQEYAWLLQQHNNG